MNKYEVSEIKKAFSVDNGFFTLNRLFINIVDGEGNIKHTINKAGALLDNREENMYFSILKTVLSTKVGKNFTQYDFPKQAYNKGHIQGILWNVKESGFNSDADNKAFINNIVNAYSSAIPYAVVSAHCTYTVRHKDKSGEADSMAEEDFKFILTAICPVLSVDSGFSYDYATGEFSTESDPKLYIQPKPTDGFMYPAFDNRSADVNSVMYYCKKSSYADISIISDVLECDFIRTAEQEKETFQYVIHNALKEKATYEFMYALNEKLCAIAENYYRDTRLYRISLDEISDVISYIGIDDDTVDVFRTLYQQFVGEHDLTLNNLIENKLKLTTSEYTISFSKSMGDKVSTVVTDGARTIKLKTDDAEFEVNGTIVHV